MLTVLNTANDDSTRIMAMNSISDLKTKNLQYVVAIKYANAALAIAEKSGNTKGMADSYYQIGLIYWYLNEFEKALLYHLKALDNFEYTGDENRISKTYNRLGHDYADLKNYDKAMKYFQKALESSQQLNDQQNISRNLDLIGFVYMNKSDYSKALEYYFKSLKICEESNDKTGIAGTCNDLGELYELQHNHQEALKFANRGLAISIELKDVPHTLEAYESLEKIYLNMNNYTAAYNSRLRIDELKTELNKEESAGKIDQMQVEYENERKQALVKSEQEKKDLQQQNIRNAITAGLGVTVIFLIVVYRHRNKIAKEKKRSDELLLNILPAETAEELKNTGSAKAKDFEEVTVLFTDFKNFTAMSEKLSAQELVNEINYCYSAFDNIITKHGIEKIKTIGDSYMCAGGLPVANKTNAEETVRAAIEIRDFMLTEKQKRETQGKPFFEIRIGCNTGSVVAGIVGIKKFAYDIWGDTVNIASRMESSGEPGKVNISGSTYELVKDKFNCEHRGKIEAKNKGMIDMYFVENV